MFCEGAPDPNGQQDESIKEISEKIQQRKQNIEKRLIEKDDDTENERVQLRGEFDGLNYSIDALKIHR